MTPRQWVENAAELAIDIGRERALKMAGVELDPAVAKARWEKIEAGWRRIIPVLAQLAEEGNPPAVILSILPLGQALDALYDLDFPSKETKLND